MSLLDLAAIVFPIAAAALAVYALFIEPYRIRLTRVEIPINGLPESLDGFTICHLADLHISEYGFFERRVERLLSSIDADICALTGDVLNDKAGQDALLRMLNSLRTRLGAYVVPGNNDYRGCSEGESLLTGLRGFGLNLLINQSETACWHGAELAIIGVDDPFLGLDDLESAMSGVGESGFRLLLAHSPDIIKRLGRRRVDLILAGHTHGGQICLPWLGPIWLHCRYELGLSAGYFGPCDLSRAVGEDMVGVRMYVTRGLSSSLLRVRFLAPPEVALLTLRRV